MEFSEIKDIVKNQLDSEGIYRTATLIGTIVNRGYKLISGMSLYDVRRFDTTFAGTRNRVSIGEVQLVKNGGFEDGDPPNEWTAGSSASVARHSSDCHSGNYCVTVTENGENYPKIDQDDISLQSGGSYTVSVWVKTGGAGTAYYVFMYDNTKAQGISPYGLDNATSTWSEITFNFDMPAGSSDGTIALVHMAAQGAGTSLMFDDCKITRRDTPICPLYVSVTSAETSEACRIHPVEPSEFEFYGSSWEGTKADQSSYYTILSPFHPAWEEMVVVPAPLTHDSTPDHNMTIQSLCAVEPIDLSDDTDEPTLPRQFHDMLVKYALFECYLGEPGRVADALAQYKEFTARMDQLVAHLKARFPSGRDFEPFPSEFIGDLITRKRQESE